jgi:hypothetical protein
MRKESSTKTPDDTSSTASKAANGSSTTEDNESIAADPGTRSQSALSQIKPQKFDTPSPLQGTQRPWPAQTFYDHDFYADAWYKDMIICMCLLALEFGIEFIAFTAGVGSKTILAFADNFTPWGFYASITTLFIYAVVFIGLDRRQERVKRLFRRSPCSTSKGPLYLLRMSILLGIILMNFPGSQVTEFIGLGIVVSLVGFYCVAFRGGRSES